ncbi:MAG TPA: hypothetical protein VFC47_02715 [Caulobacteraceae bacterium]|nr:hypothetical protein [Caulobacteraceae bacterium]
MRTFTTVELLRDLPSVTEAVARGPVAITRHRKPRYVIMAMEDFARLSGVRHAREVYLTGDLPDDVRAELSEGLAATIADLGGDGA